MPETFVGGVPEAEITALFDEEGPPFDAGAGRVGRFLRKLAARIITRIQRGDGGPFAMFLLGEGIKDRVGRCGCLHSACSTCVRPTRPTTTALPT